MTKLFARFLVALVNLATMFLSRWRKLTVRARVHDGLAPQTTVTVNSVDLTLLVPDRTSVYWPRHGFNSEPNTLSWIDGFGVGDVFYDIGANIGAYTLYAAKARSVPVVAFEPNPFSYRVLVHNFHLNAITDRVLPFTSGRRRARRKRHWPPGPSLPPRRPCGDRGNPRPDPC